MYVLFVGDDWAEDHHDVEILDSNGKRLGRARLPEGIAGMTRLHEMIAEAAQVGDFVLVMLDAFRGPDGEFAAADVVTVDKQRPDDVEVEQPGGLGSGGRRWVRLSDLALISNEEGPNPL